MSKLKASGVHINFTCFLYYSFNNPTKLVPSLQMNFHSSDSLQFSTVSLFVHLLGLLSWIRNKSFSPQVSGPLFWSYLPLWCIMGVLLYSPHSHPTLSYMVISESEGTWGNIVEVMEAHVRIRPCWMFIRGISSSHSFSQFIQPNSPSLNKFQW